MYFSLSFSLFYSTRLSASVNPNPTCPCAIVHRCRYESDSLAKTVTALAAGAAGTCVSCVSCVSCVRAWPVLYAANYG